MTTDILHTQKEIVVKIIGKEAHDVLPVKEKQFGLKRIDPTSIHRCYGTDSRQQLRRIRRQTIQGKTAEERRLRMPFEVIGVWRMVDIVL